MVATSSTPAYQFPLPPPSPSLDIPAAKRNLSSGHWNHHLPTTTSPSGASPLRTPTWSGFSASHSPVDLNSNHYSPPHPQHPLHHPLHHPFSTTPPLHILTRRRSSRLSIVMNCDDASPDPNHQSHNPFADGHFQDQGQTLDMDGEQVQPFRMPAHAHRRGSFQDQRLIETMASFGEQPTSNMTSMGPSPGAKSFLRRSSLTHSSIPQGGDLFGSLVGSYEESILSGRMSTLPSKPLIFTAQIGVLASHDYKDCPPKLRCPKHTRLEFPAVFYNYESSSHHQHQHQHQHHGSHHNHQHHHHQSSSAPKCGTNFTSDHSLITPGAASHPTPQGSFLASSPIPNQQLSVSPNSGVSFGSLGSLSHALPVTHDDNPILPYVGYLDLDNAFQGEKRFSRMPGGMRLPLRGQVQVMIKNPNKTVVKVFLVPYDFTDMPVGTKTFLRQKHYSTHPAAGGTGSTTTTGNGNGNGHHSGNQNGTLRYAIHLQFCCPAVGYVYLYRSVRVVFANRVPDGKESLRVVLEGLGLGSKTNMPAVAAVTSTVTSGHGNGIGSSVGNGNGNGNGFNNVNGKGGGGDCSTQQHQQQDHEEALFKGMETPSVPVTNSRIEERYVQMRKGEVSFVPKRKKGSG